MASIYEQVLGEEFKRLHPRIQQRFGISSKDGIASIGQGVMKRIWFNKLALLPLYVGTMRHIMFPQGGSHIPFTIENFAYIDQYGRETVSWIRKFKFSNTIRHFDATMIYSPARQGIVDYLGNKQHLAVDLAIAAAPNGGIMIRSGDQRFYEGLIQFRFPRLFTGIAEVNEWYDEKQGCYQIKVDVTNPIVGPIFQYEGSFQAHLIQTSLVPVDVRPLREEARE